MILLINLCTDQVYHFCRQGRWFGSERKRGTVVVSTSFDIPANSVRGKNLQGAEWSVQGSSKRSSFYKSPFNRWNGGNGEIPACLPQTYAATFTRKYKACSSPATLKQLRLSNHSKPWKRSKNAKWSSAKNEVGAGSLHHSD